MAENELSTTRVEYNYTAYSTSTALALTGDEDEGCAQFWLNLDDKGKLLSPALVVTSQHPPVA
jgi:hypothetical protein